MSIKKRKKPTFWLRYKVPIVFTVCAAAIVYFLIYLVFIEDGIFLVGSDLEKGDWLSFFRCIPIFYWDCNRKYDCRIPESLLQ